MANPWEMNWGAEEQSSSLPWEQNWDDSTAIGGENEPAPVKEEVSETISRDTINKLIQIESGGKADAQASTSSARGLTQFTKATWKSMVKKHKPEWAEGLSDEELLAQRDEPSRSVEMAVRLAEDNSEALTKAGVDVDDASLYLAHFAGIATAKRLYKADDDAEASSVFSKAQVKANESILKGKTVGGVKEWARKKMEKAGGKDHIEEHVGGDTWQELF